MTSPRGQLAEQEGRHRARVAERLVVVPDQPLDQVDRLGLDDELVVVGAWRSATSLAYGRSSKPSRSSKPIVNVCTGRSSCDAMIPTTALESIPPLRKAPSGTSEISRRRTAASSSERTSRGRLGQRESRWLGAVDARDRRLPVALDHRLAARLEGEHVAGRQAADALEERPRRRHVAEGEVGGDRPGVEPPRHRRIGEHAP